MSHRDPVPALGIAIFLTGVFIVGQGLWNHNLIDVAGGAILILLPSLWAMAGGRRRISAKTNKGES